MNAPVEAKVLVVDDDHSITEMLSDVMESEGYKVLVCNSSKDVLYLSRQFLPDVLLLDIMMPEIDGYDVCRFFKADPQLERTRIIVISARGAAETRMESFRAGADAFLMKPFDIEELRLMVANSVRSKQAADRLVVESMEKSLYDPVSGCHSRRYMQQRLRSEFKRTERHNHPISLVLLDLDRFESVNTRHGYEFGNRVLQTVAQTLREGMRESDVLGRFQQDSFLIILPETPAEGAKAAVARIQQLLESITFAEKKRFTIDATVVHNTAQAGGKPEVLLANVEDRLRRAQQRKFGKR